MPPSEPLSLLQNPEMPLVYLYPLNDTFLPKVISLSNGQRVPIGRQPNTNTTPGERNGYFDSKVLSRQHAELWEELGKIYIKDVKSSNGTFINGQRLSQEGFESPPFEIKTDDIVQLGIDIVGEGNQSIIHHKVLAHVTRIPPSEDAISAWHSANNFQHQSHQPSYEPQSTVNCTEQRRAMPNPQSIGLKNTSLEDMQSPARSLNVHNLPIPSLVLDPLNSTFIHKCISLTEGQPITFGRQTNARTCPGEGNGYFHSKVLSRQHAKVWEESGKIYIRDVKSSNGTFINGERLSQEGIESEPFEIKTGDVVEFGSDIIGEDNETIIHHKVAIRMTCILSTEDAVSVALQLQPAQACKL